MTLENEKAPVAFANEDLFKIRPDLQALAVLSAMLPPVSATVRGAGDVAADAANLTLTGGRYALAG
jgi:hypothetical protein